MNGKFLQICFGLISLCNVAGRGQSINPTWFNNDNVNMPNAQQGDIVHMSLFTGTANIVIPLFPYSLSGIDAGVTLAYNTQGIRVDQLSTAVGIGWQLNNMSITRQMNGTGVDEQSYWGYPHNGYDDQAADYFYCNLGNRNLTFLFSKSGSLATIPQSNIKVQRLLDNMPVYGIVDYTSYTESIPSLSFIVTDESGNNFYFEKSVNGGNNYWDIQKVVTYEGTTIGYDYEPGPDYSSSGASANIKDHMAQQFLESSDHKTGTLFTNKITPTRGDRLLAIHYPNYIDVIFNYDKSKERCDHPGDYRLSKITIKEIQNPSGVQPNSYSYVLNQAYFYSPNYLSTYDPNSYLNGSNNSELPIDHGCTIFGDDVAYRLKLLSIDKLGLDNTSKRFYTFDYSRVPLPERVVGGSDLFGFANGYTPMHYVTSDNSNYWDLNIPIHAFSGNDNNGNPYNTIGMIRTPTLDVNYVAGCSLQKITNGSNGSIQLSYGTAGNISTTNLNIGGLAVNHITYYDGYNHDNDITTYYQYADAEEFLGENDLTYGYTWYSGGTCIHPTTGTFYYTYTNSANVINTALDGSNYGFKTVTETTKDVNNHQVNKTISTFTGFYPGTGSNDLTTYDATRSNWGATPFANKQHLRTWGIGLLTDVKHKDYNDNILTESIYTYNVATYTGYLNNVDYKSYIALIKSNGTTTNTCAYIDQYEDVFYPITGSTTVSSVQTLNYYNNYSSVSSTATFLYDAFNNLIQKQTQNSLGQVVFDKYYFNYSLTTTGNSVLNKLHNDGVQHLIAQDSWKTINDSWHSGDYIYSSSMSGLAIISGNIIRPKYLYAFVPTDIIPASTFNNTSINSINQFNSGSAVNFYKMVGIVTKYDNKGNGIEATDVNGSLYNATIFDVNQGAVLARASNAKYTDIAYCGFESAYDFSGVQDYSKGNLQFSMSGINSQYALTGRCSYHVSYSANTLAWTTSSLQIGKNYTVSFWIYNGGSIYVNDGVNNLPNSVNSKALTVVAHYGSWQLYKTSFIAQGTSIGIGGEGYIDEFKLYPTDAVMTNSTYIPLIGKVADVDQNDNITTYEYDGFGNNTIVRDFNGNILSKTQTITQGND